MWFLTNPDRLKSEVSELEALRDRAAWLLSIAPSVRKGLIFAIGFVIEVNSEPIAFTLEYPALYPDVPPKVTPVDRQRLSIHQYGAGGELCLEYRSDNWDPSITGAMMVDSTYRLLAGERPTEGERVLVPSAHDSTLGQRLRGTFGRFLLTRGLLNYATALNVGEYRLCHAVDLLVPKSSWAAYISSIGPAETPEWREDAISIGSDKAQPALLLRVESLKQLSLDAPTLEALVQASCGLETPSSYNEATTRFTVLSDQDSAALYCTFLREGGWIFLPYATIDLTKETGRRLPEEHSLLRGKRVGVVGCGSLGSKIATSLARSGVGKFVLVDHDILKPGNLVRHDLDAASLGSHKTDALAARLKAVSPFADVKARRVILGGQESSGTTASVLDELAECDLIIDATADPQAFNYVASVARSSLRPIIWAEVYAGGIGGFVARVRPDSEPPPHKARQQYLRWCHQQGVPWLNEDRGYESRGDGELFIADDAEVSIIAAHATRMGTDHLIRPEASIFPHPAYLVGLSKSWLFKEPLDIHPIDFVAEGPWQLPVDKVAAKATIEYLTAVVEQQEDENRTGT
jgi:hypothetical protein